jgi:hypothetical protein
MILLYLCFFFECSTPRSLYTHTHIEPSGHKFYQPHNELFPQQYQQPVAV